MLDTSRSEQRSCSADLEKQSGSPDSLIVQQQAQDTDHGTENVKARGTDGSSTPYLHGWRLYTVQTSLCFTLFLAALDSSIVSTSLVTIGREFNDFVRLQWVVLAYLLTELGFAFVFARISDVIGRKWATIIAVAILTVGSLACGLAQNLTQLIVFRALQGVGGSGAYSMPFTVLPEITPPEKFALLSAFSALTFVCSSVLGPTLGGVITTHSTWRWIFLFNVPIGACTIAVMMFTWPKTQRQAAGRITWRQFDVVGFLLSFTALVLLIFSLQEAGAKAYAWSSGIIITTLTLSCVSIVGLVYWISYLSSASRRFVPIFPARIVINRVLGLNAVVTTLAGCVLFTILIELPGRFQLVSGKTPQTAGLDLLPFLGSSAAASAVAGWLSRQQNRSFYTMTAGIGLIVLATGLLSSLTHDPQSPRIIYLYEVLLGFGFGGTLVSTTITVKLNASEKDAASAQGIQSQARVLGGNIGLALATVILNNRLDADLKGVLSTTQIDDVRKSLNAIEQLSPSQVAAVRESFAYAFRSQMQVCIGIAGAALIFALSTWQRNPPSFLSLKKALKK